MLLTARSVRRAAGVIASALLGSATTALAQSAVVTGKVTSAQGTPIEAANAFITELAASVGTNAAGQFSVTIPAERVRGQAVVLRIRAIGYVPQTRAVTLRPGPQTVDFVLQRDVNRLSDIVVTGVTAGTESRKVPFVVSSVSEKDMPVIGANPLTQLQGKVPGANIVGTSGRPGAQPAVLLRGPTAINGSGRGQQPLYVVDGVILASGENGAGLPDLNPQDIESVEVVKGAAAASLYGARAGNGVIQITTKSGRNQRDGLRWTINSEFGSSDIEREFALAQNTFLAQDETARAFCTQGGFTPGACQQRIDLTREALRINQNGSLASLPAAPLLNDGGIAAAPNNQQLAGWFQANTWPTRYDPVAAAVTPSGLLNTNIDVQGRTGKTNFFGSVSYIDQQGALRFLQGYDRWSTRLNLDQGIGDKVNLSVRTFYSRNQQDGFNQSGGENNGSNAAGFFALTRTPAYVDLLRTDNLGRLFVRSNVTNQGGGNGNPLYSFQNSRRLDQNDRFIGGATLKYSPTTWFDVEGNASIDRTNGDWFFQQDRGFRTLVEGPANLGTITRQAFNNQSINSYVNATARKDWSEDLKTRLTARYLYEQQDFRSSRGDADNLVVPGLTTLAAGTQNQAITSGDQSIRQISYFTELSAEYKDRYFFSGLLRRDGSSLFGAANRWANFGRASLGWDVAREGWFFIPGTNQFKLRASYGTAGGRPSFAAQYETYTIGAGGALQPNILGNRNLRPETIGELEVGVDVDIKGVGFQLTRARSESRDQILPVPPPAGSGFQTQWQNAGTLTNTTWEASLNIPVIQKKNLNWSTRLIWDRNRAVISRLDVPPFTGGVGSAQGAEAIFLFRQGERLGTFFGRDHVRSCDQLPAAFASQCGGAGSQFQRNSDGWVVWTGGRELGQGITDNLWQAQLPAGSSPWGQRLNWGMPILLRDSVSNPAAVPLGNALPRWRGGWSHTLSYKRFSAYGLMDLQVGQTLWNQGYHWSLGDFMTREQDMAGRSVQNARPIGYGWRAGPGIGGHPAGVGGFYDILFPGRFNMENPTWAKLRETAISYRVGRIGGKGDWTVGLVGRNLLTLIDGGYRGFDPETGVNGGNLGSSALNAIDRYNFPNLRSFTMQVRSTF